MRNLFAVLVIAALATACGGDSSSGPSPIVSPTPMPRELVGSIIGYEISPMNYGVAGRTKMITAPGVIEITAPYSPHPPDAYVQLFLFNTQQDSWNCYPNWPDDPVHAFCANALPADSQFSGVDRIQPQRLKVHVRPGQTYWLMVRNRGPRPVISAGVTEMWLQPDS